MRCDAIGEERVIPEFKTPGLIVPKPSLPPFVVCAEYIPSNGPLHRQETSRGLLCEEFLILLLERGCA